MARGLSLPASDRRPEQRSIVDIGRVCKPVLDCDSLNGLLDQCRSLCGRSVDLSYTQKIPRSGYGELRRFGLNFSCSDGYWKVHLKVNSTAIRYEEKNLYKYSFLLSCRKAGLIWTSGI